MRWTWQVETPFFQKFSLFAVQSPSFLLAFWQKQFAPKSKNVGLTLGGAPLRYPTSLLIRNAACVHYFGTSDLNTNIFAI